MDREDILSQNQGIANQSENGTSVPLSTPAALPCDVIIEILTWLPVMALLRFKTACKEWKAIIESDNFISKHYNRSLPCVVTGHEYEQPADLELKIKDTYGCEYLGIYYGMIVEADKSHCCRDMYRIRNPATHQIIELPDPHDYVSGMFLHPLSSPGDFKLISLYDNGEEAGNGCQILSLDGSDNPSWRPMSVPNLHQPGERLWQSKFVLIGQVLHCVIERSQRSQDSKPCFHVLSLDIEKECFLSIITPHNCFPYLDEVQPFQYNGELAFAKFVNMGLQVHTLEADDKKLVKNVVLPLRIFKDDPDRMVDLVAFAVRGSEVWLNWGQSNLFMYDTVSGRITSLKALPQNVTYRFQPHRLRRLIYAFPLNPSLIGIKGMGSTQGMCRDVCLMCRFTQQHYFDEL